MKRAMALAAVLLATGALSAGRAGADVDTELSGYSLVARAPAIEVTEDHPGAQTHPEAAGVIPEAQSQVSTGTTYALSAIVWPGTLAANLGTLLIVAGGSSVPAGATMLNDPIRAEARVNQTKPDVTYSVPGATMASHVTDSSSSATASLAGLEEAAFTVGNIASTATSHVEKTRAVSESTTRLSHVSLADGVITIDAVTSHALATTDGTNTTSAATTVFSGLKIAGQGATIDSTGLHLATSGSSAVDDVTDAVNKALAPLGITLTVTQPARQQHGATLTQTAPSLLMVFSPPQSGGEVFTASLGGTTVTVAASPPTADVLGGVVPGIEGSGDLGSAASPPSVGASAPSGSVTAGGVALPASGGGAGSLAAAPASGGLQNAALADEAAPIALFDGIGVGWAVVGFAIVLALSAGLLRGATALLAPAGACDLEFDQEE